MYLHSKDELLAPFSDPQSPVLKADLHILVFSTHLVHCPYSEIWDEQQSGLCTATCSRSIIIESMAIVLCNESEDTHLPCILLL